MPQFGVRDVVPDAPATGVRLRRRHRHTGIGKLGLLLFEFGEQRLLAHVRQTRKANAEKANRTHVDRIE